MPTRTRRAARRRAGFRGPRGVEHLRSDGGDGGGVPGEADGAGSGQHRAAAAGLGPRSGRPGRAPGGNRGGRRAGDRWRRVGALPRPGEGRREVRAHAHVGVGAGLPQRRPGPPRARRPLLPGPRGRPGQGRGAAHRTRRGRLRAGESSGGQRWRGGCASHRQRHTPAGGLHRQHRPHVRPRCRANRPRRLAARRAGAPTGAGRRTADAHVRQGRPTRPPVAGRERHRHRRCRTGRHHGLGGRVVARRPGCSDRRTRGRLLRTRRRLTVGGTAGVRTSCALPGGDGGRSLRPPAAGVAGRLPRRTRSAAAGADPRRAPGVVADPGRAGDAVASAGHPDRHAVGGVAGIAERRRRRVRPGSLGGAGELVVGSGGLPGLRHPAGADGHRRAGCADAARRPRTRHLPAGRGRPPEGLARRAAG